MNLEYFIKYFFHFGTNNPRIVLFYTKMFLDDKKKSVFVYDVKKTENFREKKFNIKNTANLL